jgi:hypothetical protein
MVVLLLAIVFLAATVLVLTVAGVLVAVLTGIGLLNVFVVILGFRVRRPTQLPPAPAPRWQPTSFRRRPVAPYEADEQQPTVTVRRQ